MLRRRHGLLFACVTLCAACGWPRSLDFESHNGAQRIEIFQPPVDPMLGLRIDYVTGQRRATLLRAGESYVGFAHVYWPENSPTIGILICGTREVRIAYN